VGNSIPSSFFPEAVFASWPDEPQAVNTKIVVMIANSKPNNFFIYKASFKLCE
jgi:hypothetical protein